MNFVSPFLPHGLFRGETGLLRLLYVLATLFTNWSEMSLASSLSRSIARSASRQITKEIRRGDTYRRIQKEASERPESIRVETPVGTFWMSPIEQKLYEAMRQEGLSPTPQYRIESYIADFAFPDIKLAVEADGAAYHSGDRRQRDNKRDWILRQHGWTVKRFYGTTIHTKASNCAYVVRREVLERRSQIEAIAKQIEERRRQAKIERTETMAAIARPFQKAIRFLMPKSGSNK